MIDLQFTKICFICNENKNKTQFYKHSGMSDGCVNKCKECCKKESKKNYHKNALQEDFLEKERQRRRVKYLKSDKKMYKIDMPKEARLLYSNLNRKLHIPKGYHIHHWSYEKENILDVFILSVKEHNKAHTYLKRDVGNYFFIGLNGEKLNSRQSHFNYLIEKGVLF